MKSPDGFSSIGQCFQKAGKGWRDGAESRTLHNNIITGTQCEHEQGDGMGREHRVTRKGHCLAHLGSPSGQKKAWKLVVQFSPVAQSCPTLCDPMKPSIPGLPVHYQLPESTQTHVHRVGDAIQPSHSLSPPSPPALNPSQHQGLFQ